MLAALPVVAVLLSEDRAHVERRGSVRLAAGRTLVRIEPVAPVLADKSLTVALGRGGAAAVRVGSVRVERRRVVDPGDRPADVAALERELVETERTLARLDAGRAALEAEIAALDALSDRTLAEVAEEAAAGRAEPDRWRAQLRAVAEARADADGRRLEIGRRAADTAKLVADLDRKLDEAGNVGTRMTAAIVVELTADADVEVELRVDYLVPGACWRPWHTAELCDEGGGRGRVRLRSDACVWQSTGEEWSQATLSFSTERASLGLAAPELVSDVLRARERRPVVDVEARDVRIHTAGLGAAGAEEHELPGIDDRGSPVCLRAPAPAAIPPDGRPYRVPLFDLESECEIGLVLAAELSAAVVLRTVQEHGGSHPLLAGPVDLVRGGGLVGRAEMLFVAPGERFELGWGPDPALRVHREHRLLEDKTRVMSNWRTTPHRVTVRLSNIGPEPKEIGVTERVPVSEIAEVEIALDTERTTRAAAADADGFVRWRVRLEPYGRDQIELAYAIRKRDSVVGL
jgi:uncharacterized protein (TIGR02231 family)